MADRDTTAVLLSGGLDSAVLLDGLLREHAAVPLYVRTGHIWEATELHWTRALLGTARFRESQPLVVLELPVSDLYGAHWSLTGRGVPGYEGAVDSNYLPGRNLLLLSKAAVFCALNGISRLVMAPLSENPFPDGTPVFFEAFARAASLALDHPLAIEVPFRGLTKAEVIRRAGAFPFELTFSCIQPREDQHCGECTKCAERRHAFAEAGVPDPTSYRSGRTPP